MRRGLVLAVVLIVAVIATWRACASSSSETAPIPPGTPATTGPDGSIAAAPDARDARGSPRAPDETSAPELHTSDAAATSASPAPEALPSESRLTFVRVSPPLDPQSADEWSDRTVRVEVVAIDGSTGDALEGVSTRVVPEFGPEATLLAGSGTGPDVAVHRTGRVRFSVTVEPPRGFGGRTTQRIFDEVARGAARVRVAVPLYPEFVVSLRAIDEEGRPVAGVRATEAAFGDARFDFEDRPHEGVDDGFFTDRVEFTSDTSGTDGVVTVRLPGVPFERFAVRVAVPLPDGEPSRARTMLTGIVRDIRPDANARGAADVVLRNVAWIHGRGVWGTGHAIGCGFMSKPPPAPLTLLVVRVLRRDGRPAAGVQVRAAWTWRETGEDGTARFEGLKEGPVDVVAGARGFLASALRAEIGRDAEVVVRESPPRTARVTVTDVTGRPIPAARITAQSEFLPGSDREVASHGAIALLDGDCDVITPMTGRDGTLSLFVPAGRVKYYASVGGASESVVSADDEVRIVVTKPVRPPPAK